MSSIQGFKTSLKIRGRAHLRKDVHILAGDPFELEIETTIQPGDCQ